MSMKHKFFLILSLSLIPLLFQPATAQEEMEPDPTKPTLSDKIIDKILGSNALVKQAISELAFQRCKRFLVTPGQLLEKYYVYGKGTVSLNPMLACNKAAVDLIKALDYYQEKVVEQDGQFYHLRLVFKTALAKLIQDPSTTLVLKNISAKMRTDFFSLYDSVYEVLPNKEKTLEFIAVMLQDFSPEKLHYHYLLLEKSRNKLPSSAVLDENLDLLEKVLSRLPYISAGELVLGPNGELIERTVEFYPSKSLLNLEKVPSLAYHYWVPAYVAFKLSRTYGNADVHSYLSSFSFNYFYEILFRDDIKLSKWSTVKQILSIEDAIITNEVQAFDIYLGHEGPYFALNYSTHKWPPKIFVKQIMTRPSPACRGSVQYIK